MIIINTFKYSAPSPSPSSLLLLLLHSHTPSSPPTLLSSFPFAAAAANRCNTTCNLLIHNITCGIGIRHHKSNKETSKTLHISLKILSSKPKLEWKSKSANAGANVQLKCKAFWRSSLVREQGNGPEQANPQDSSIQGFVRKYVGDGGILSVQLVREEHLMAMEELLVDSFAESMWGPLAYRPLLSLTVRRYLREKLRLFPTVVTLVGFYSPAEEKVMISSPVSSTPSKWLLVGTVEVSFSDAEKIPIVPPFGFPYLCNMAVQKCYRRRGIGWQLLRAAEELAVMVGCRKMHLHCRLVDSAPLQMYKKAGYIIEATDSIWILFSFQRRRHLMVKSLDASRSET